LLAGTNDCNGKISPQVMKTRMSTLLDHIYAAVPRAQVFVADVVGTGNPWNDCIVAFNALVPAIVDAHAAKGQKVWFTPMYNETRICGGSGSDFGLCGGHQIHPTAAGYPRMASAFARAVLQHFTM
jgi:lysophospholipase L1-like esterase